MEILGARPVWSMSDSEKLSALDAVVAEEARLKTLRWQLTASLDASGYAKELGAGDTARLLSTRYRQDLKDTRRDVRLANRVAAYTATSAALPNPTTPFQNPTYATPATDCDTSTSDSGTSDPSTCHAGTCDAGTSDSKAPDSGMPDAVTSGTAGAEGGVGCGWQVSPAQAAAIVAVLDQVPSTVPLDNLEVAERELIGLAATHTPQELRRAGRRIRDLLDPDGPEPDEKEAYTRESLTLKPADRGVTFTGYLANENAELFRTLIHTHARPHRTTDAEPDPRPLTKRQADALTTILNTTGLDGAGRSGRPPSGQHAKRGPADAINCSTSDNPLPGFAASRPARAGAGSAALGDNGEPTSSPDPETPRTNRRAFDHALTGSDADAGIDSRGCGGQDVVPGHGQKPHISITINYDDLVAATPNATGTLIFGDNLSAATVRRLACDAAVLPIILGSKSQPLDVGTSQRLVTRAMRRALNARDKGCVVCGAPPNQTEAHHIIHWADGGPTAITNLALLRLSRESSGPGVGRVFGGPGVLPLPVRRGWLVGV
ncbi:HNH endonuclease signature motif containing protein [Kribbella jejuensis]|uniref:HNH endonuclease n=1 Tax=Kribbella jejuensis TaxID=236068 RepID=A0A542DB49_9ACTN|nr:HNH endonuclease signature motif containing protein [Kribbella jejuensis]TQJ00300.1 HNH endonuclease [Kribbella jejuensis]